MIAITLEKIAQIVNGTFLGNTEGLQKQAIGLQSDSRKIKTGDIFAPIVGERVDGHDFIQKAFEAGAVCCFCEKDCDIKQGQYGISVKSVVKAMLDLAEYIIKELSIPVVAVTGSVGKTTTKDMIASVLEQKYNVLKTAGNYNTNIGMPLMAAQMTREHNIAVLEMGMNSFGEIHNLSIAAKPKIAVITNVGVAHMEMLGSREGILKAKSEIFDGMNEKGIAILNSDNDKLQTLEGKIKQNILWYGIENKKGIYADNIKINGIEAITCDIHTTKGIFKANITVPGEHMVMNTLAATAVGLELGLTLEQIQKGIASFVPTKMRMNIIKTNGLTIINDVYNANPVSMKSSLDVLAVAQGRKVAILGFMGELGEKQAQMHKEVGEYVGEKNIDVLISIGEVADIYNEGAKQKGTKEVYHFDTQEDFWQNGISLLKEGDTVLIKASRSKQFEKTVEKLQGVK
jgi:UDP-N-acetylmuramoyl-tripeptide--D-alanyl-D-alanine ligase